ncbi:MAG TPA: condensation domain-containing protein, partial [Steroidobacteraceae bacterium]
MSVDELLRQLKEKRIVLSVEDDELVVVGNEQALEDRALLSHLRKNKQSLIELIEAGTYEVPTRQGDQVPPNRIPPMCERITPEMLTLIQLEKEDIDRIVSTVPGGAPNIEDIYPLAPLQEGLLFHHLLETEGDRYITRQVIAFDTARHLHGFLAALQRIIDRHDVLRTAILWDRLPQPVQVVCRKTPLRLHELSLPADGDTLEQLLSRTDPRHLRIDLQRAPLLAAYATRRPRSDEWFLALLSHHLVCDHVTNDLILAEIQMVLRGQDHRLPPSLPYRNFIAQLQAIPPAEHEAYFRAQLGDVAEPTTPFGLGPLEIGTYKVNEARSYFSTDLARDIRQTARAQRVTAAVLFHVAWSLVVAQCTGRDDVVFGTVLFGRLRGRGLSQMLGMFINTLPLRIHLSNRAVRDVVLETYQGLSELLIHEQASLATAQRCSGVPAPMPLFTSLLNYRHSRSPMAEEAAPTAGEWTGIRGLLLDQGDHYPFEVSVDDLGEDFCITLRCALDPHRVLAYLRTAMESLVVALAEESPRPVLSLSIMSAAERQQLLFDWNATDSAHPNDRLIHGLVEAHAAARPEAPALMFEHQSLSYGQLNAKANQLAHHLLSVGIRP